MDKLIGKAILVRTVTYFMLGRVESIEGSFLVMEDASWVADTGRFGEALTKGNLVESEYAGSAWVNSDSIVDIFPWNHDLPKASI